MTDDVPQWAKDYTYDLIGGNYTDRIGVAREIARLCVPRADYEALQAELAAVKAEGDGLREALLFYEEKTRDCRKISSEGNAARNALDRDGGTIARAALKGPVHD